MAEVSPITGIIEEDKVFIEGGEHEGKSVYEVSDTHPNYYDYLVEIKKSGFFAIRRHKDKSYRLYVQDQVH